MIGDVNRYCVRGVIRYLNGDIEEFRRLRNMALQIYEEEEYNRKSICTIGELTPAFVKNKIYQLAGRRRVS
ncbi:hypothetical protein [Caloranaerobacter ferrireducens]|uniref:hypothetical protein n=1 Tax=Caloranaerobacter ferrireducens TaxID=1323370 RepID=UPI00084D38E7|nr:hypothetical protein [Caloranaerobacter ferrireducens]